MDIGDPTEHPEIEIVPLSEPLTRPATVPVPARDPLPEPSPERVPEKVPAGFIGRIPWEPMPMCRCVLVPLAELVK